LTEPYNAIESESEVANCSGTRNFGMSLLPHINFTSGLIIDNVQKETGRTTYYPLYDCGSMLLWRSYAEHFGWFDMRKKAENSKLIG